MAKGSSNCALRRAHLITSLMVMRMAAVGDVA